MLVSILVVFAICTAAVHSQGCPGGWVAFQNSCYGYVDHAQSWPDASATCTALGGFLVEIFSEEENKFIQQMATDHNHNVIWLGADDLLSEGNWYWAKSGTKVEAYTDWAPNQPDGDSTNDENCMEMNIDKFAAHWNDDECEHHQRFICQKYMEEPDIVG